MNVYSAQREDGVRIRVYEDGDGGEGYYARWWWVVEVTSADGEEVVEHVANDRSGAVIWAQQIYNGQTPTGLTQKEVRSE